MHGALVKLWRAGPAFLATDESSCCTCCAHMSMCCPKQT